MESSKELRITKPLPSSGKKYHKSHKVSVELEDDVFVSSKLNDNEKTDCIDNSTSDISTNKTASTGLRRNSSRIFGYVSTLVSLGQLFFPAFFSCTCCFYCYFILILGTFMCEKFSSKTLCSIPTEYYS